MGAIEQALEASGSTLTIGLLAVGVAGSRLRRWQRRDSRYAYQPQPVHHDPPGRRAAAGIGHPVWRDTDLTEPPAIPINRTVTSDNERSKR